MHLHVLAQSIVLQQSVLFAAFQIIMVQIILFLFGKLFDEKILKSLILKNFEKAICEKHFKPWNFFDVLEYKLTGFVQKIHRVFSLFMNKIWLLHALKLCKSVHIWQTNWFTKSVKKKPPKKQHLNLKQKPSNSIMKCFQTLFCLLYPILHSHISFTLHTQKYLKTAIFL